MTESNLFSESEYLNLLELTFEIAESMDGIVRDDGRLADMQNLALKIYYLGTTARWLYHGTKSPMPKSTNGSNFVDFSSIAILTRAVIETYLIFFEVFVSPENDDEFEFNFCLWHLAGLLYKGNVYPPSGEETEEYKIYQGNIKDLSARLAKTKKFSSYSLKEKRGLLKGNKIKDRKTIAKKSDISTQFLDLIYGYTSGYTHSDGNTSQQLFSTDNPQKQKEIAQLLLTIIMVFICKFIIDYGKLNPETKVVLLKFKKTYDYAILLSKFASELVWPEPLTASGSY